MPRTKTIKAFEALIGDQWRSWQASDRSQINRRGDKVFVTTKVDTEAFKGVLTTEFDLKKLPAFSIGT